VGGGDDMYSNQKIIVDIPEYVKEADISKYCITHVIKREGDGFRNLCRKYENSVDYRRWEYDVYNKNCYDMFISFEPKTKYEIETYEEIKFIISTIRLIEPKKKNIKTIDEPILIDLKLLSYN
jgi:hypothetical protein